MSDTVPERDPVVYFDGHADVYSRWSNGPDSSFVERLAAFGRLFPGQDRAEGSPPPLCIDLGCGSGALALMAAERGYEVVAIDGSDTMLASARIEQERRGIGGIREYRRERLPLSAHIVEEFRGQADLLILSSVIEYVDDDEALIGQVAAVLATGGRALISFPNARALYRKLERRVGGRGPLKGSILTVQRRQYASADVRDLCSRAGLRIEDSIYFALPSERLRRAFPVRRPAWLGTLLLVSARRIDGIDG